VYVPFLSGPAPATALFTGLQGGVDIPDAHTGRWLLRVILPEPFAMLSADVDGLHGRFLAIDKTGQRIFARTASGSSNSRGSRLESEPSAPVSGSSSGRATLTIRGSGFKAGVTATIGGKSAAVTLVDMNTLKIVTPALNPGKYGMVISNSDGEAASLDASFIAN